MFYFYEILEQTDQVPYLGQSRDKAMCFCCEVTSRFWHLANQRAGFFVSRVRGCIELTYIFWWEISCVQVFEEDGPKTLSEA